MTFLLDLAYARYGAKGSGIWTEALAPAAEHCDLLVAWSASKSFAQYGKSFAQSEMSFAQCDRPFAQCEMSFA